MRKLIFTISAFAFTTGMYAQQLTEITNVRLWEHHSSFINGGQTFGNFANGDSSGYDFVTHQHYNSFDTVTYDAWTGGQIANIDMVEHNGLFGNGGNFGFTSGVSTIWGGSIKGNSLTKYMLAPSAFNYDTTTKVSTIRNAYVTTSASLAVQSVAVGQVYLARIRNTDQYVALKITNVKNGPDSDSADYYFSFKYKYGTYIPTEVEVINGDDGDVDIFPNPSHSNFSITLPTKFQNQEMEITIYDVTGRIAIQQQIFGNRLSHNLLPGNYYLKIKGSSFIATRRLIVE